MRAGKKVIDIVPAEVKSAFVQIGNTVSEQQIYEQALGLLGSGFKVLEEQAARVTVSEDSVIKGVNATSKAADIESLEEVCRIRAYDVSKVANKSNLQHIVAALVEGGGTGVAGFAGIPFNLVVSLSGLFRILSGTPIFPMSCRRATLRRFSHSSADIPSFAAIFLE